MYCPENEVTREQMAVFITRALGQVPPDGYCGSTAPFSDVAADRWSCKYVKRLVELGITSGIGGWFFDPEGVVTREQMAAFITRALVEVPADGYCGTEDPFTDVPYSLWSCKYIKRLMELGVTSGIGEGLYGSGNPVTRAQMAVFLARAFLGME
jgi:Fe2+ transport system protein FeoA